MSKKRTYIIVLVCILSLLFVVVYFVRVYFQPHIDIEKSESHHVLKSDELISQFEEDAVSFDSIYSEKILEIEGVPTQITQHDSLLSFAIEGLNYSISIKIDEKVNKIVPEQNQNVVVKGLYVGYLLPDSLFGVKGEIQLNRAIILN